MGHASSYRTIIISTLRDLAESLNMNAQVETVVIADQDQDQYLLVFVGWEEVQRVLDIAVYIRMHRGKIWIEQNTLPDHIGEQLISAGIPRDQIVLGFQPQELRHLTNFAAA